MNLFSSFHRIFTSGGFLLVVICFFFNFITLSCNKEPIAQVKGWTLVLGGKPEPVIPKWAQGINNPDILELGQNGNAALTQSRRIPVQPVAAIPVVLAVAGILAAWAPRRMAAIFGMVFSVLSLLSLGLLHHNLSDINAIAGSATADLKPLEKEDLQFLNMFSIEWGVGFWAAGVLLLAVCVVNILFFLQKRPLRKVTMDTV